jgi:hypothetical protein
MLTAPTQVHEATHFELAKVVEHFVLGSKVKDMTLFAFVIKIKGKKEVHVIQASMEVNEALNTYCARGRGGGLFCALEDACWITRLLAKP